MGSSAKSYLWPRCGMFHQIPTLARLIASLGKGYRGKQGSVLCPNLVRCRCRPPALPRYICAVWLQPLVGTYVRWRSVYMSRTYVCANSSPSVLCFGAVSLPSCRVAPTCSSWPGPHVRAHVRCVHVLVPCDSSCACDPRRTRDRCKQGVAC